MSILSRFTQKRGPLEVQELPHECGHWEFAPRWDAAADIGIASRVVFYTCTNCREVFTPEEVESLRAS